MVTEEEADKKKKRISKDDLAKRRPIGQLKFEMRNVKLKVPKVPHEIFGRIVLKDEFFPTAIGTFKMELDPDMFVDRLEAGKKRKV